MSWWITGIWPTISDRTPPCPTGRQQQDGGTVASSSWDLTKRRRNYYFSPFLNLRGCIMYGTFVLAALVAVFPGINFVLLDSDCLPVTLFEVEDLWTEAYLARFPTHGESGIPQAHPLRALARYSNDSKVVYTQSQVSSTRMGQAALVVSEPHAELNAGLIVIFRFSHLFLTGMPGHSASGVPQVQSQRMYTKKKPPTWPLLFGTEWVSSSSDHALAVSSELSSDEKTLWIQSGLALTPLNDTCLQYSLDFCLAWTLMGEWTSRVLFPVAKTSDSDMSMQVPSFKTINVAHLASWRRPALPLNKMLSPPC